MQVDVNMATQIYFELKFWLPVATAVGLLWKVFQGVNWLKSLKTEVLDVKAQLASQTATLQSQLAQQTNAIVSELKESRQDIRMLFAPAPRLARARSSKKVVASSSTDSL